MKLLTKIQIKRMKNNWIANEKLRDASNDFIDFKPVVKLFTPDSSATWLLTEISPETEDIAFGLCDLGLGYPEIGYVSLSEIREFRGNFGLPVERDYHFEAEMTLQEYAREAEKHGRIMA